MIRKASMIISALVITTLLATASYGKQITIRGKLQRTVEAGGWLIVSGDQKYLILNSSKFVNEKWFVEGSEVEATGEVKKGVMTIYMEGTPFEAHSLRARATKKSQAAAVHKTSQIPPTAETVSKLGDERTIIHRLRRLRRFL